MKSFRLEKSIKLSLVMFETLPTKRLSQNVFELTFSLLTEPKDTSPEGLNQAQLNQNISFAKCNAWLESFCNYSCVLEADSKLDTSIFDFLQDWENTLIVLPDLHESTITSAIHAKLNTICEEGSHIDEIVWSDTTDNVCYRYFNDLENGGSDYDDLPDIKSWMGEFSYFDTPWWFRNDSSTIDRPAADQIELDTWIKHKEKIGYDDLVVATFNEIDQNISDMWDEIRKTVSEDNKEPGELIDLASFKTSKKEKWKPTLV